METDERGRLLVPSKSIEKVKTGHFDLCVRSLVFTPVPNFQMAPQISYLVTVSKRMPAYIQKDRR